AETNLSFPQSGVLDDDTRSLGLRFWERDVAVPLAFGQADDGSRFNESRNIAAEKILDLIPRIRRSLHKPSFFSFTYRNSYSSPELTVIAAGLIILAGRMRVDRWAVDVMMIRSRSPACCGSLTCDSQFAGRIVKRVLG